MTTRKLQTLQGGHVTPIESENEELDFASVRVGASKAVLSEVDAQTLGINRKIRTVDGTNAADVATKGQVDTVASTGSSAVTAEAAARLAADNTEAATRLAADNAEIAARGAAITAEALSRSTADTTLQTNITAEASTRATNDTTLQTNITAEASTRATADTTLQTNITAEAGTRATADSALDVRLTAAETEIGVLDGEVAAILANNPKQKRFVVAAVLPSGGVSAGVVGTVFDTSTAPAFVFDVDPTILDVELWINGARWVQCTVGDFSTGGFRKNSDHLLETSTAVPANAEVVVWKQGTNSAGGGGSGADLDAITTDPKPSVAAGHSLGTLAKPWSGLYLKDTSTSQVYRLEVISGVFQATLVP